MKIKCLISVMILLCIAGTLNAQNTSFTYQGSLNTGGSAANGNHDFEFALFDSIAGGSQLGTTLTRSSVAVSVGVFSVSLDFGSQFPGANRFLEIRVRPSGGGAFTPLAPRQPVTSSPYSIRSLTAETATNATNAINATNAAQLGGVAAGQYVLTGDPRMTDARNPLPGSASYIQNQNAGPQASTNFNISGNGTAGGTLAASSINAATHYSIGGSRILSITGTQNLFIGDFTGPSGGIKGTNNIFIGFSAGNNQNNTGGSNIFIGSFTGSSNQAGNDNTFVGRASGRFNNASNNTFFGSESGEVNATGTNNAFFGRSAGALNTTGSSNSFFGTSSGQENSEGVDNSFFGVNTGRGNTSGNRNSYYGRLAGRNKTTGSDNTAVGFDAGGNTNNGNSLTLIGAQADVSVAGLSFATAIGAGAEVGTSNAIQLGRTAGTDTVNVSGKLKIGTLGSSGATTLCRNASNEVGTCSSSIRYKSNVDTFRSGLALVHRLRPVHFNWKTDGSGDMGLVAEEVAKIEPLLTTTNDKGEIEGVKYDRVGVVLINAVKEQQAQIESQADVIKRQQQQIDALMKLVCATNADAAICATEMRKEKR